MNEMKQPKVGKVVVNIGEGQVGDEVEKAYNLIEKITGQKPVRTESGEESKTFGKRSGLNIGAKVTLRGQEAEEFLEKVAPAIQQLDEENFDGKGNFGFGISEYIDVPGVDYDADIGMKGFEVIVSMERPGYRVKKRDHKPTQVGKEHQVTDQEAINYVQDELGIEVNQ